MTAFAQFLVALFWYAVLILVPGGAFSVLIHFLLSLPMRRRDRKIFRGGHRQPADPAAVRLGGGQRG